MRILVTGGAGFIGSHVVDAYAAAGHSVAIVDDLITVAWRHVPAGARTYTVDIRDPALADVFAREQPEVVNHHAAHISVHRSVEDPLRDASVNIHGTLNLLECARRAGTRKVIYASSGGAAYGEPRYLPCDEDHPVDPLSPYGVSKHTPEHYLALYQHLHGLAATVLRYPNVYGPRQDPDGEGGVVAIFGKRMLRDEPVTIFGDGEQARDFVAVADLVRANVAALTRADGAIVNLGSGVPTTVNEIFRSLAALSGYRREPTHAPPRAGEVYRIVLTNAKAKELLAWAPAIALDEGLASVVADLRAAM